MKVSETAIEKIKEFEGCRYTAYMDAAGTRTIGYGHTKNVSKGQICTSIQADRWLREDIAEAEAGVESLNIADMNQYKFDALCDFAFNLGIKALSKSTLLKKIRRGDTEAAIRKEFSRWVYAGGKRLNGLVFRRAWEANRYFQV